MNKKTEAGLYGSYLSIYIMHRNMHENGSLSQSFQVNMSVTCYLRIFIKHVLLHKPTKSWINNL